MRLRVFEAVVLVIFFAFLTSIPIGWILCGYKTVSELISPNGGAVWVAVTAQAALSMVVSVHVWMSFSVPRNGHLLLALTLLYLVSHAMCMQCDVRAADEQTCHRTGCVGASVHMFLYYAALCLSQPSGFSVQRLVLIAALAAAAIGSAVLLFFDRNGILAGFEFTALLLSFLLDWVSMEDALVEWARPGLRVVV